MSTVVICHSLIQDIAHFGSVTVDSWVVRQCRGVRSATQPRGTDQGCGDGSADEDYDHCERREHRDLHPVGDRHLHPDEYEQEGETGLNVLEALAGKFGLSSPSLRLRLAR